MIGLTSRIWARLAIPGSTDGQIYFLCHRLICISVLNIWTELWFMNMISSNKHVLDSARSYSTRSYSTRILLICILGINLACFTFLIIFYPLLPNDVKKTTYGTHFFVLISTRCITLDVQIWNAPLRILKAVLKVF